MAHLGHLSIQDQFQVYRRWSEWNNSEATLGTMYIGSARYPMDVHYSLWASKAGSQDTLIMEEMQKLMVGFGK